jgi:hypothetical protein
LMALALMIRIGGTLPPNKTLITPSNAEQYIHDWADKFSYSVKKVEADQAIFALELTGMSGKLVKVALLKKLSGYVVISSAIYISPEHQKMIDMLTDEQKGHLFDNVAAEAAKARLPMSRLQTVLEVERRLPLDTLNEDVFMQAEDDVEQVSR